MTWSSGVQETPCLRTYDAAVAWEAQVAPIRRRTPECKPLGNRRCTGLEIKKEGKKIIVRLYGTDVVTYHPNGVIDIHIPSGGVGITETRLYWSLLRLQARFFDGRSWLHASDGKVNGWFMMRQKETEVTRTYGVAPNARSHTYKTITTSARLLSKPAKKRGEVVEQNNQYPWEPFRFLNPEYPKRTVINRAGTKEVRSRYKNFEKLLRGVIKLERANLPEGGDYSTARQINHTATFTSDDQLFKQLKSKDMGQQMLAARTLAHRGVDVNDAYDWPSRSYNYKIILDEKEVKASYHRVIYAAHKQEAYTTEVITDGTQVKNRHKGV